MTVALLQCIVSALPTKIDKNPCFEVKKKKVPGGEKIPKTGFVVENSEFSNQKIELKLMVYKIF